MEQLNLQKPLDLHFLSKPLNNADFRGNTHTAYQVFMGKPFVEETASNIEKYVFDVLLAMEESELSTFSKRMKVADVATTIQKQLFLIAHALGRNLPSTDLMTEKLKHIEDELKGSTDLTLVIPITMQPNQMGFLEDAVDAYYERKNRRTRDGALTDAVTQLRQKAVDFAERHPTAAKVAAFVVIGTAGAILGYAALQLFTDRPSSCVINIGDHQVDALCTGSRNGPCSVLYGNDGQERLPVLFEGTCVEGQPHIGKEWMYSKQLDRNFVRYEGGFQNGLYGGEEGPSPRHFYEGQEEFLNELGQYESRFYRSPLGALFREDGTKVYEGEWLNHQATTGWYYDQVDRRYLFTMSPNRWKFVPDQRGALQMFTNLPYDDDTYGTRITETSNRIQFNKIINDGRTSFMIH